jgi:hypothetical protein
VNDKNEQSQSQGQEVPPDPFPELDSFILGLTPEQLKIRPSRMLGGKRTSALRTSCMPRL